MTVAAAATTAGLTTPRHVASKLRTITLITRWAHPHQGSLTITRRRDVDPCLSAANLWKTTTTKKTKKVKGRYGLQKLVGEGVGVTGGRQVVLPALELLWVILGVVVKLLQ
jgi:hypothetical protein